MSFTQDELQAFNNILEQRLTVHRREIERVFEQRLQTLKRDIDQRFTSVHQDLLRDLPMRLSDQQQKIKEAFSQQFDTQQSRQLEAFQHNLGTWQQRQQEQIEGAVENALAAQLLAIEQLISQRDITQPREMHGVNGEVVEIGFEGTEVPAEITWEDLIGSLDKLMDKRFSALFASVQVLLKDMERNLIEQLQQLREELPSRQTPYSNAGSITNIQEVFTSIEQLERIVESMQVAMTANHALLSNRLYHHRQLSYEHAHPGRQSMNVGSQIPHAKEENDE
jgi:hypothetical protein